MKKYIAIKMYNALQITLEWGVRKSGLELVLLLANVGPSKSAIIIKIIF